MISLDRIAMYSVYKKYIILEMPSIAATNQIQQRRIAYVIKTSAAAKV